MYRMLIVDDEERIVNSIYDLMEERFDFELHRCHSAVQAMTEVKKMRFDVIISDIAMPQMSGLELVEEVHKIWPKCHFLMLTAYNSFEYAYEALKHDRVDYLLKVESYDTICEVIAKKRELIEQERRQAERLLDYDRHLHHLNESMRGYFLKRMIVMGTPLPAQSDLDEIALPIRLSEPVLLVLAATEPNGPLDHSRAAAVVDDWISTQLEQYGLQQFSYTSAASHSILFAIQPKQGTTRSLEELTVYIHTVFENLSPIMEEQTGQRLAILCSDRFIRWTEIHTLYQRCAIRLENMRSESGMMILLVDQEMNQNDAIITFPNIDELALLWEMIKCGNLSGFRAAMQQGLGELCKTMDVSALQKHASVTAIGYLLTETTKMYAPEYIGSAEFQAMRQCVGFASGTEWLESVFAAVENILASNESSKENKGAWLVQRVDQYIEQHYAEDITLTALAEIMHYSPSYLSRFYKTSTGTNLMNRVYDVRIAKARELLSHTNLKVNEIAARTGFCSSKYFNRVFKKATGISAAQYREAHSVLPGMKS